MTRAEERGAALGYALARPAVEMIEEAKQLGHTVEVTERVKNAGKAREKRVYEFTCTCGKHAETASAFQFGAALANHLGYVATFPENANSRKLSVAPIRL